MSNIAPPADRPQPRRLKFKEPDPRRTQSASRVAAREVRKRKGETFPQAPNKRGRLPDGARFDVKYDAENVQWLGTLTVGDQVFEDRAGGVMVLLGVLDAKYRATTLQVAPL